MMIGAYINKVFEKIIFRGYSPLEDTFHSFNNQATPLVHSGAFNRIKPPFEKLNPNSLLLLLIL